MLLNGLDEKEYLCPSLSSGRAASTAHASSSTATGYEPGAASLRDQTEAATGDVIGVAALGSESDIDAAVRAARRAFDDGPWGRTTAAERAAALRSFADALEARAGDTATLVTARTGCRSGSSQQVNGGLPAVMLRIYADVIEN